MLTFSIFRNSPELLKERQTARAKSEAWDRPLVVLLVLLPLLLNTIAGFDRRFRWCPEIPMAASLGALLAMLFGIGFTYWAMKSNPFFSSHVRIQRDRKQELVATDPTRGCVTRDTRGPSCTILEHQFF